MWYAIIIFVIVFEAACSIFAPYFPGITTSGEGLIQTTVEEAIGEGVVSSTIETSETTTNLVISSFNPFSTFIDIMTFQAEGAVLLSIVFVILDLLLLICVIRLIRGSD